MRVSQDQVSWVEAVFAHPAFLPLKDRAAPLLIVAVDPLRAVWANAGTAALVGGEDVEGISRRFLGPKTALAQPLDDLARTLEPGSAPRLQRVRVMHGLGARNLTLLCHRPIGPLGASMLALAVVGPESVSTRDGSATWLDPAARSAASEAAFAAPELALAALTADRSVEQADIAETDSGETGPADTERKRRRATIERADHWRFLWRTDPSGRLLQIDSTLFGRLGAAIHPSVQRSFADAVATFDPEKAERLRTALASGRTWSGMQILWPLSGGRGAVPVTLGASPQYEAGRQFGGFRGFGLIDVRGLRGSPEALDPKTPPSGAASEVRSAVLDPATAGRAAGEPAAVAEAPEPAEAEADQDLAPTREPPPPPANVVRLWPLHAATPARPPADAGDVLTSDAGLATESDAGSAPGESDGEASCPGPEVDHSPDHIGSLSLSDHFAFQEIARALGAKIDQAKALLEARDASEAERASLEDGPQSARPECAEPPGPEGEPALSTPLGAIAPDIPPPSGKPEGEQRDGTFRLRALLDAAGDAIATVDDAGRVLTLNRQGERWFGQERRRLAGDSFTLLLAPESRALAASLLAEVKARPEASAEASCELVARTPEGSAMPLSMTLGRIGDGLFSALWRDLSTVRRLENELARAKREAERAGGREPEFLAKVSHEIRTPLNAILGFAELMTEERFGPLGNARYKDFLQDIHASGTHVMNVIDDLLDLSRIEAGRHDLQLGSVEINKVVGDCVAQMQPQARRERVIVRTSLAARLPAVMADERSVRQIVTNLLSNAVKFNEPGGQVIVSTALSDTGAVVARIRDTGTGMSDEDIAAALEPFRQLAPSKQAKGTGLGLPLTKALAGANGASLSIRSRPHEGTLVEVMFAPAAAPAARVPA